MHVRGHAVHAWLESRRVTRDEIRDLCVDSLVATLLALPDDSRPSGLAELTD